MPQNISLFQISIISFFTLSLNLQTTPHFNVHFSSKFPQTPTKSHTKQPHQMFQLRRRFPAADKAETNLDVNMVIVLAAMLCALVGALAVNSIIRCVWRWRRRWLGTAGGLERGELEEIPVAVFGAEGRIRGTECAICLGEFENGDDLRILPKCNHGFHVECIDAWLVSHSSCPICRHSLLLKTAEDGGGGGDSDRRAMGRLGDHQPDVGQMTGDIIILIRAI